VSAWLREPGQAGEPLLPESAAGADTLSPAIRGTPGVDTPPAPAAPAAPWASWEEVRQVREALKERRGLFLRRPDHLSARQQAQVEALLASPMGPTLSVVRDFLTDWYALFKDKEGQKRSLDEAQARYDLWHQDDRYAALAPLRRALASITPERFAHLSQFLRQPAWEATNNGAERAGRGFRHRQGPHFNLRSVLVALLRRQRVTITGPIAGPAIPTCGAEARLWTRAERAHRRLSWASRLARNAQAADAPRYTVIVCGIAPPLAAYLGLSSVPAP